MKPTLFCRLVLAPLLLAGCASAPPEPSAGSSVLPPLQIPAAFRHGEGAWVPTAAVTAPEGGAWWRGFDDPVLDALAERVEVANATLAASVAAYRQARALVAEQRASLFPSVVLDAGASRVGGGSTAGGARGSADLGLGASWEPDLWGRLARGAQSARAAEQASAADLAAARLSLQGELSLAYFNLRGLDAEIALLAATLTGYERSLQIASNRYEAGIVARTDVLQA